MKSLKSSNYLRGLEKKVTTPHAQEKAKYLKVLSLSISFPSTMRLTSKKIEEILALIIGEEGLPLVRELQGKENISEFDLATKIKKDIKVVRKMLYLLYNQNLVEFTRKKDKQKGWYIYYWTLLPESIRFNYFKMKRDLLEKLKALVEQEEKELFFTCPNKCVRLDFDQAMDFEFHCPECGELIVQDDSKARVIELKERIVLVEAELKELKVVRKERHQKVKEKIKKVKKRAKIIKSNPQKKVVVKKIKKK